MLNELGRVMEKFKYNTPSFTYIVNGAKLDKKSRVAA